MAVGLSEAQDRLCSLSSGCRLLQTVVVPDSDVRDLSPPLLWETVFRFCPSSLPLFIAILLALAWAALTDSIKWVACQQQTFILMVLEAAKSEVRTPAQSGSGKGTLRVTDC